MKRTKQIPVILECGHVRIMPDASILATRRKDLRSVVTDTMYCRDCGYQPRRITRVIVYKAVCTDCTYRNLEGDLCIADELAWAHCRRKTHRVELWYPQNTQPVLLCPESSDVLLLQATA